MQEKSLQGLMKRFQIESGPNHSPYYVSKIEKNPNNTANVELIESKTGKKVNFSVPSGNNPSFNVSTGVVETESLKKLLVDCMQVHSQGDFCIFGEKGVGKTTLVNYFASALDYQVLLKNTSTK